MSRKLHHTPTFYAFAVEAWGLLSNVVNYAKHYRPTQAKVGQAKHGNRTIFCTEEVSWKIGRLEVNVYDSIALGSRLDTSRTCSPSTFSTAIGSRFRIPRT